MSSGVIYTTVTNGYDGLKQPLVEQQLAMVCFNNVQTENSSWRIKPIELKNDDPVRTARYYKLHPHLLFPDYDWSIWVDGSLLITSELNDLLQEVQSVSQFGVYKHAKRDCLYQAAANCIDKRKDDPSIIKAQMSKYRELGYPEHQGLVASGVLVRKHHDPKIIELMDAWWHELANHSRRDQLSFNYVCWKNNFKYHEIPDRIGDGRFFRRNPHRQ
jgi:hypothetical protein